MTIAVNIFGAAKCYLGSNTTLATVGDSGVWEYIGYTVNGVDIQQVDFSSNVPGDQNGGPEGPPIDIQQFGEIHYVTLRLNTFDTAVVNKIKSRIRGATYGNTVTPGTLSFAGEKYFNLHIQSAQTSGNRVCYPFAIPRGAITDNLSTKYRTATVTFECHASSGVLLNTTDWLAD